VAAVPLHAETLTCVLVPAFPAAVPRRRVQLPEPSVQWLRAGRAGRVLHTVLNAGGECCVHACTRGYVRVWSWGNGVPMYMQACAPPVAYGACFPALLCFLGLLTTAYVRGMFPRFR